MNTPTPTHDLPVSNPCTEIHIRIAGAGRCLEKVAWYPIKPSQEGFAEIQREANRKAGHQASLAKTDPARDFKAVAESSHMATPKLDTSLRNHWLHNQAIAWAQACMMLVLLGARFLWERRDSGSGYWTVAHWVLLLWIGGGFLGRVLLPEFPGLTQRFAYIGFYLLLLVVVREIERRLKLSEDPEAETENSLSHSPLEGDAQRPHPFLQSPTSHP